MGSSREPEGAFSTARLGTISMQITNQQRARHYAEQRALLCEYFPRADRRAIEHEAARQQRERREESRGDDRGGRAGPG